MYSMFQKWMEDKYIASGVPANVTVKDHCKDIFDDVEIEIDPKKFENGPNPGLRAIAKLMLNSLWVSQTCQLVTPN